MKLKVQRKIKDVAIGFDDFFFPRLITVHRPRALHPEGCLEVGFRAGEVAQHEDSGPGLDGDARGQFAARERNGFAFQRIAAHGLQHGRQGVRPRAGFRSGADDDLIVMVKDILALLLYYP